VLLLNRQNIIEKYHYMKKHRKYTIPATGLRIGAIDMPPHNAWQQVATNRTKDLELPIK
jgi:hypothetical protein